MTLAVAQMRPVLGQPLVNTEKMLNMISEARAAGAETILFPELCLTGPFHDELSLSEGILNECREAEGRIAHAAQGIRVFFGSIKRFNTGVYRSGALEAFYASPDPGTSLRHCQQIWRQTIFAIH